MLLNMVDNEFIKSAFGSLDMIVNSTFAILATVNGYQGTELCQGLLFGVTGSNLVLGLGRDILAQVDNVSEHFDKQASSKRS